MNSKGLIPTDHIKLLTGVRGFAVLLVLFSHAGHVDYYLHPALDFSGAGRYGVFLFFVLSAFLLTRQFLIVGIGNSMEWLQFSSEYLLRRFFRIYPMFFIALLTYFLYGLAFDPLYIRNVGQITSSLLLMNGPGIFWTVPVEFQYYFLLPVVAGLFIVFGAFPIHLLTGFVVCTAFWQYFFRPEYVTNLGPFLSIFLIGSLTAFIADRISAMNLIFERNLGFLGSVGRWAWILPFAFFLLLIPRILNLLLGSDVEMTFFHLEFILFAVLSGTLIITALSPTSTAKSIFESLFMQFWGKVSYSAYLWHMLVLELLKGSNLGTGWFPFLLFLSATAALAFFTYRVVELPVARMAPRGKLRPGCTRLIKTQSETERVSI